MRSGAPRSSIRLFQGNSLPWGGLMPKGDEVMEVRKLKTVIAGCGKIFPMHAVPVSRDPHAVLTAVCDVKPERAGAAAERFGCRAYTDFEVMLEQEKPDVVHICTPHYLHAPLACLAMEHGCHVLTEKPMAIALADARRMLDTAAATGRTLGVIFQNRYNAGSQLIRRCLDNGDLGEVRAARVLYVLAGAAVAVCGALRQNSYSLINALCTFLLVPALWAARRLLRWEGGWQIELFVYAFACLGWTLGGAAECYETIPHFDKLVHMLSGVFVSMLALALFLGKLPRWLMRSTWANPQPMGNWRN